MTRSRRVLVGGVAGIAVSGMLLAAACGDGDGRRDGVAGAPEDTFLHEPGTTFEGTLAGENVEGVEVCIDGTDPEACGVVDEESVFSVSAPEVSGDVFLLFRFPESSAVLCLTAVPLDAVVTLTDVACLLDAGTCTPASITVDPEPATPVGLCQAEPQDGDGDGVPDGEDVCPMTPPGESVDEEGCSVFDRVPCGGPITGDGWQNHGQYVSTVADVSRQYLDAGIITAAERDSIVQEAARSNCGKVVDPPTDGDGGGEGNGNGDADDPADDDGDGVPNETDACPGTPDGTVVNEEGCSIAQLAPCDGDWRNHGHYVWTVADVSREFVLEGLMTTTERSITVQTAARSDCGKK